MVKGHAAASQGEYPAGDLHAFAAFPWRREGEYLIIGLPLGRGGMIIEEVMLEARQRSALVNPDWMRIEIHNLCLEPGPQPREHYCVIRRRGNEHFWSAGTKGANKGEVGRCRDRHVKQQRRKAH